jgi:hypothetical protein
MEIYIIGDDKIIRLIFYVFKHQADGNLCVQLGKVPHILDLSVTRLTGYFQFLSSLLPPSFGRRRSVAVDMMMKKIQICLSVNRHFGALIMENKCIAFNTVSKYVATGCVDAR